MIKSKLIFWQYTPWIFISMCISALKASNVHISIEIFALLDCKNVMEKGFRNRSSTIPIQYREKLRKVALIQVTSRELNESTIPLRVKAAFEDKAAIH